MQANSIKEMDQANWVCYKFGENSYYYGEVGLLDQAGVVHPKDNPEIAADPKTKLVKHGFGIYIYNDATGKCKYEGTWSKDQKNGKGVLTLKDGATYQGQFKDGFYHDSGVLKWTNGDSYDGRWKKGRMDGAGVFKRRDGFVLKGSFKNNYFIDINTLRNPFMSEEEYEDLKKRRKQLTKQQQKNQKIKTGFLKRIVPTAPQLTTLVTTSNTNNRVPLLVSSQECSLPLSSLLSLLPSPVYKIDLRKHYKLEGQQKYAYLQSTSQNTRKCLKDGGTLLLMLDDGEVEEFEELFYPEVRELYASDGFNVGVWAPKDIRKGEVKKSIIGEVPVSENFRFAVWTKLKLQEGLSDDFVREKLQKRFESVLPYIKIDVVFINKAKEEEKIAS